MLACKGMVSTDTLIEFILLEQVNLFRFFIRQNELNYIMCRTLDFIQ